MADEALRLLSDACSILESEIDDCETCEWAHRKSDRTCLGHEEHKRVLNAAHVAGLYEITGGTIKTTGAR